VRQFDLVVASHGGLAAALLDAAAMICGPAEGATAVGLDPSDSPEAYRDRLVAAVAPGRPTLILTDLYGGTPQNVAIVAARSAEVRLISGANLGLLIEALTADEPLGDALVERLVASARDSIVDLAAQMAARR
jgi:D-glucosaminate-specific PTS system IIA component